MSYRKRNHDKERLPPFVPLLISTLNSPAWRRLSHGAARLYIALRCRYSPKAHNNGRIFLSQREAHRQLRSHHIEIGKWFRELQFYGFIVMTSPSTLGLDGKGKSPHWRLTELGAVKPDGTRDHPTNDFLHWDGTRFRDKKIQNPVSEILHGVCRKSSTPPCRKSSTPKPPTVSEIQHIQTDMGVSEIQHITSINHSLRRSSAESRNHGRPRLPEVRHLQPYVGEPGIGRAGRYNRCLQPKSKHRPRLPCSNGSAAPIQDWFASRLIPDPEDLQ